MCLCVLEQDMFGGSYADSFDFAEVLTILGRRPKNDDQLALFQKAFLMFDPVSSCVPSRLRQRLRLLLKEGAICVASAGVP